MKKFLFLLSLTVFSLTYTANSQNAMTGDESIDSLTTSYIYSDDLSNTSSAVSVQIEVIKLTDGNGTSPAGYMYLEGSNDGVYYAPIRTWKTYTYAGEQRNVWAIDTFTITSTTASNTAGAAIPMFREVCMENDPQCNYLYIRGKVVLTQGTARSIGVQRQNRL